MHRFLLVALLCLGGCQGVVGPFQARNPCERINDPRLSIDEQMVRERDRLALPEGPSVAPRTWAEIPFGPGQ